MKGKLCNISIKLFIVTILIISIVLPTRGFAITKIDNEDSDLYTSILKQEAEWISSLQFENGAIPTYSHPISNYNGKYKVVPYFTHLGLLGLLEKEEHSSTVKDYMDWYFEHLNREETESTPAGSVYDYIIETDKKTETPTNDFDSTDSYASTFINLLRKYAEVTGDYQYLKEHKEDILLIASAMLSTKQEDGLTWAKPSYKVKYLMDNTEVYKGLEDMVWICNQVFNDQESSATYSKHQTEVFEGIQNELWISNKNIYSPGKMTDGTLLNPDWNTFYADATAQLFPIWTGIIDPKSNIALEIYNTFNEYHPGWPVLEKEDAFPWALIAYTAAIMGDKIRVDQFLETVKNTYIDENHPWPWYVMESGITMLTASKAMELSNETKSFEIANLGEQSIISEMPYTLNGTAKGIHEVNFEFTHELTSEKTVFTTNILNGSWSILLEGLLNGDYLLKYQAKDKFNNIIEEGQFGIEVKVGNEANIIKDAYLISAKTNLHRDESTEIKAVAHYNDGSSVDLSNAQITYHSDQPEVVEISDDGLLVLKGIKPEMKELTVWAFVKHENNVVRTKDLTIPISSSAQTLYDEVMNQLSSWIVDRQLDNGAITLNQHNSDIKTASSNVAALGLLLREETIPNVKKYMDWYMTNWNWGDNLGVYGTHYDYYKDTQTSEWKKSNRYESSSVINATFISLLKAYYEKENQFLTTQYNLDIMTGGLGIMRTQASDGLMWKHPGNTVKSFEDNALTLQGMKDSVWLFEKHFNSSGPASYFKSFASQLETGIENHLWNNQDGYYYLSLNQANEKDIPDLTSEADVAKQLTGIYTGLIQPDSERAIELYNFYNKKFPNWYTDSQITGDKATVVYTAALMGDKPRVNGYLERLVEALADGNIFQDLTVEQAGYLMLAADLGKNIQTDTSLTIEKPVNNITINSGSVSVKGKAVGVEMIKIYWHERFSSQNGVLEVKVLPNGKWIESIKKLNRGSEYEIKVVAIDENGYQVPNTAATIRFAIAK
ncbi:hypothetical protein V7138_07455 [Bacillus sp. JJ1533]|uniref:hypothetical protein n=1 Tax=Bacillus sp. JJ1533 TaxID=3122959 RepID=UPI002FFFD940